MGSLTALLVLASMMPVFTEGLPKASYTKVSIICNAYMQICNAYMYIMHICICIMQCIAYTHMLPFFFHVNDMFTTAH